MKTLCDNNYKIEKILSKHCISGKTIEQIVAYALKLVGNILYIGLY